MLSVEEQFRTGDLADLGVDWEQPGLVMWMLIRGLLGRYSQEGHLIRQSPGRGKTGKEKNLEKGGGREKGSVRSLESDRMTGQGTVITERIGTTEIEKEPGTRRRKEIVDGIVTVIGHVIAIEVGNVVANMSEKGIVSDLETGTETGTGTMKLGRGIMTVDVLVTGTMTMIMKLNMTVTGMVKENVVMTMTRTEDGTSLTMHRSILRLNMMTRTMAVMGIIRRGGIMMKMLLPVMMTVIIITLMTVAVMSKWMKIITIKITMLKKIG